MMLQRRSIALYGLSTAVIVLLVVVVAAIFLDTSNNIKSSSSNADNVTQSFSISSSSLHATTDITNDSTSGYPWLISHSNNNDDDENTIDNNINDETQHEHIGPLSDFISISNITRSSSILPSPTLLRNSNNRCTTNNQSLMRFTLITDNYPWETSWKITNIKNGILNTIAFGPPLNRNYERTTRYIGELCLTPGEYNLRMKDKGEDGLCCNWGQGSYTVTLDGDIVVSSDDSDFIVKDHPFVVLDTNNVIVIWNTPKPTSKPTLRPTTKRPTPLPTIRNTSNPSPRPSTRRPTRNPTLRPTPQPTIKPPISFKSFIGGQFFNDERSNEASGLALAPDKSHLIVVSDNGKIFFLNLLDYNSGHCVWEDDDVFNDNTDFEGVAIVPNEWSQNNKIAYLIHEGADDDRPYLYKIGYTYNSDLGSCSVQLVESYSLRGALPCLTTSDGIESLTWKVGTSNPAVFYVGVEDTGRIYEITSDGNSNGDVCFDGGMGRDGISSLVHDGTYLWSVFGEDGKLAVIDPARDGCTLAVIDIPRQGWDTEGLVIDFENNLMYRAVDEGGDSDPSIVAVYDFTYNIENKECISDMMPLRSCSGFTLCGR